MSTVPSIRVGVAMLRANPLRTLLSTLGVVMGVGSLVSVLALGDGMERFAREQMAREGYDLVVVTSRTQDVVDEVRIPRTSYPVLEVSDARALREATGATAVTVMTSGAARLELPGATTPRAATARGIYASAPEALGAEVAAGRLFTESELASGAEVALVSRRLALVLAGADTARLRGSARDEAAAAAVGRTLVAGGRRLQVIGVVAAPGGERGFSFAAPLAAAERAMAPSLLPRARDVQLKTMGVERVNDVKARAERWVAARGAEFRDGVSVSALNAGRLEQMQQGVMVFKLFMGALTGVSLLVGGIGIMNVLLAAVAERTREIGIRKATGARRRDIMLQFLAESVAISGAGSAVGIVLGLAIAFGATAFMRMQTEAPIYAAVSWRTVVFAGAASAIVGLIFGTYPALRAARLSPIEAIRHE